MSKAARHLKHYHRAAHTAREPIVDEDGVVVGYGPRRSLQPLKAVAATLAANNIGTLGQHATQWLRAKGLLIKGEGPMKAGWRNRRRVRGKIFIDAPEREEASDE
jgi:hypothetical protein